MGSPGSVHDFTQSEEKKEENSRDESNTTQNKF